MCLKFGLAVGERPQIVGVWEQSSEDNISRRFVTYRLLFIHTVSLSMEERWKGNLICMGNDISV
jgi:hypothetical protein